MQQKLDFLSARMKVERACKHILDVEEWFRAYRDLNRYKVRIDFDFETGESEGSGLSIGADPQGDGRTPNGNVFCIVGDAVHNLRSALDHVAAAIFRVHGEDPERASFPIDKDRKSLISQPRYREIEGLAPSIAPLIADYICSGNSADLFVGLNHLDRADKHRALITTVAMNKITVHCIADENETRDFALGTIYILEGGKFPAAGSLAHSHNERNSHATADIVFGEGEIFQHQPVIPTLHQLVQLVAGLINALERANE
jgi:hypothetical protein